MLEPRIQQHYFENADLCYQVAEHLSRSISDAAQLAVHALTSGGRLLLAGSGSAMVLAQLVAALGQTGDVLVLFSLGDEDPVAQAALAEAHAREMAVVLLGAGLAAPWAGLLAESDVWIAAPVDRAMRAMELHLLALHALCDAIDVPLLALIALSGALSACAPLVVGGAAVGGALMFTDRRTSGTQVEDEGIEFKASARVREQLGAAAHVNVTSYNRVVLLTGEVPDEAARARLDTLVAAVENVRSVVNETAVAGASSMTARSGDLIVTGKVKASLLDAKDVQANAVKVNTERGVVYLMGRVTEREAARAAELARGVGGVSKVVRVFELISEDELKALTPAQK